MLRDRTDHVGERQAVIPCRVEALGAEEVPGALASERSLDATTPAL